MTVEQKMQKVIDDILNRHPNDCYIIYIKNDGEYNLEFNGEHLLSVQSNKSLQNHWREEIKRIILLVLNEKITKSLNEI